MYSEKVMDHFQHPRNVGEIENASGVGTVGNAKCGDIMRMYLDIDDNGVIQDCKFKTFGCGAAVATSSMATELVKGKTIQRGSAGDQQGRYGGSGRTSTSKSALFTCWQRKQFMRHSGITQRSIISRLKDCLSLRTISVKVKKRTNTRNAVYEKSMW